MEISGATTSKSECPILKEYYAKKSQAGIFRCPFRNGMWLKLNGCSLDISTHTYSTVPGGRKECQTIASEVQDKYLNLPAGGLTVLSTLLQSSSSRVITWQVKVVFSFLSASDRLRRVRGKGRDKTRSSFLSRLLLIGCGVGREKRQFFLFSLVDFWLSRNQGRGKRQGRLFSLIHSWLAEEWTEPTSHWPPSSPSPASLVSSAAIPGKGET